jgi:hypothetical protein
MPGKAEVGFKHYQEVAPGIAEDRADHVLTYKETFSKILDPGAETLDVSEYIKDYLRENRAHILDYFMRITDLTKTD